MEAIIVQLKSLQEYDTTHMKAEQELLAIPQQIQKHEEAIRRENEAFASSRTALQTIELKQRDLEAELKTQNAQLLKYKTQQLEVKKSEEYEALNKEMEALKISISELETEGIALLMEIDEEREVLAESENQTEANIKTEESFIQELKAGHSAIESKMEGLKQDLDKAVAELELKHYRVYEQVKGRLKRPPFLVSVSGSLCKGCHLKLANNTVAELRKAESLVTCENCGRLLCTA